MIRRGLAPRIAGVFVLVAAACGGRVDGVSGLSGSPDPGGISKRPVGGGPGTTRPAPAPTTPASAAAQIAEAYCKSFSSCCVGAGQPPIDVSRCRELTSVSVEASLDKAIEQLEVGVVEACVEAIRARTLACANEDVAWWGGGGRLAIFGPSSIQIACAPLTGQMAGASGVSCSSAKACAGDATCAVDECSDDPGLGQSCAVSRCLDSTYCKTGTCASRNPSAVAGTACAVVDDCALGFVCFKGQCATAREHPELYTERYSPYRVAADTCKVWIYR